MIMIVTMTMVIVNIIIILNIKIIISSMIRILGKIVEFIWYRRLFCLFRYTLIVEGTSWYLKRPSFNKTLVLS